MQRVTMMNMQGEKLSARIEMKKIKLLRNKYGVYNKISLLNLLQIPIHMVNFSLIRDIAGNQNHPLHQGLSTDGFLWFSNLAATDPLFLLPIFSAFLGYMNVVELMKRSATQGGQNPLEMFKPVLKILPLISIQINCTFPAALNLYFIMITLNNFLLIKAFNTEWVKKYYNIAEIPKEL